MTIESRNPMAPGLRVWPVGVAGEDGWTEGGRGGSVVAMAAPGRRGTLGVGPVQQAVWQRGSAVSTDPTAPGGVTSAATPGRGRDETSSEKYTQ
ncbi:hypothetical protein GCM10009818_16690 [Nakamurella flavida]